MHLIKNFKIVSHSQAPFSAMIPKDENLTLAHDAFQSQQTFLRKSDITQTDPSITLIQNSFVLFDDIVIMLFYKIKLCTPFTDIGMTPVQVTGKHKSGYISLLRNLGLT